MYKMNSENDLSNCHFLPLSSLEKVIENVGAHGGKKMCHYSCHVNLLELQKRRTLPPLLINNFTWRNQYHSAIRQAVSTHDWDKLQILITESPIWDHRVKSINSRDIDNYMRALVILLIYHPSAKAQSLLEQFMHMVLACRSDEDKKAFMKLLVSLPERLVGRSYKVKDEDE